VLTSRVKFAKVLPPPTPSTLFSPDCTTVDLTKDDTSVTSSPTTGTKRKSAPASNADDIDLDEIEIPPGATLDSADVVRNKINRFIESGEMKVKDFVETLGVSGTGYHRFMHQHGPSKGMQSDCYIEAWKFFEKRKVAGLKMPTKKKAKTDNASNSPASAKKNAKSKDDGIPDLKRHQPQRSRPR
jgi:hypothetical protein